MTLRKISYYCLICILGLLSSCELIPNNNSEKKMLTKEGKTPLPGLEANTYRYIDYASIGIDSTLNRNKININGNVQWNLITPILDEASETYGSDYIAVFGILKEDELYTYHEQPLDFSPQAFQDARGEKKPYIFEYTQVSNELVKRVAIAYIPASEQAKTEMSLWLEPKLTYTPMDSIMSKKRKSSFLDDPGCSECMSEGPTHNKIIASSTLPDDNLIDCGELTYCDGSVVTVTAEGNSMYYVTVDFDWIINQDDTWDASSGGAGSSSSCLPPYQCNGVDNDPEDANPEEEEEAEETVDILKPCDGDPVKDPEIAPQKNSGIDGGRNGDTRSGGKQHHGGIDIKADIGDPIYNMYNGQVVSVDLNSDLGNFVTVQFYHNQTYYTLTYGHLAPGDLASNGSSISAGDIVGYQGDSGNLYDAIERGITEPHTHIKAKERTGRGWNLENDFTDINPEELLATKFDEDGNSTPPEHCTNNE